jgi:hypothetical protein
MKDTDLVPALVERPVNLEAVSYILYIMDIVVVEGKGPERTQLWLKACNEHRIDKVHNHPHSLPSSLFFTLQLKDRKYCHFFVGVQQCIQLELSKFEGLEIIAVIPSCILGSPCQVAIHN